MTKEITNNIKENIGTQKILFRILFAYSVALFVVYMYLVGSITFNVIARKSLENSTKVLTEKVNELEMAYFKSVNMINKDYAQSKGFVDVSKSIFASRDVNHVAIR